MREKILSQLVAKHPGVSKRSLGLIADKLAKKVTEESGIEDAITAFDNAIGGIDEYAKDIQKESDFRVTEAKKEWEKKKPTPTKTGGKTEEDDSPDPANEPPSWAKQMQETMNNLLKKDQQASIRSKAAEQLKGIPAKFWESRNLPETEEDLATFAQSVKDDYTEFKQHLINEGLAVVDKPAGAAGGGKDMNDAAIDAKIKNWAAADKANNPSQTPAQVAK